MRTAALSYGAAGEVVFTWSHSLTQLEPELAWEMGETTSRVGNPFVFYSSQHRCRWGNMGLINQD